MRKTHLNDDKIRKHERKQEEAELDKIAAKITFVALSENETIDEITASEHYNLFAKWQVNIAYTVGNIRRYNDDLYKCLQSHTSQENWTPDKTAALWKKIGDPTEEFPEWSQPIGAADAYNTGDKVTYNERHWVSTIDANVWSPDVYGWKSVE